MTGLQLVLRSSGAYLIPHLIALRAALSSIQAEHVQCARDSCSLWCSQGHVLEAAL